MKKHAQWTPGKKACIALLAALVAAGPAIAQEIVKANNADDLDLNSSWTGGSVPGASNVAVWDNTSASGSFLLGADLEFQGIRIGDPGGVVTISVGNTLSLGSSGIDLESRSLNIVPEMLLTAAQEWTIGTGLYLDNNGNPNTGGVSVNNQGHDLTINVASAGTNIANYVNVRDLQGSGDLIKDGLGRVRFTDSNINFTGNIVLNDGVLHAGSRAAALGSGSSTLTLNGGQLTFNGNTATTFGRNTTVGGDAEIFNNNSQGNGGQSYTFGTLSMGAHTLTVNRNDAGGTPSPGNITFGATTLTGNATFNVGDHGTDPAGLNQLTLGAVGDGGSDYGITKTGEGTLILTGANTYTGATSVTGGMLLVNGSLDENSAVSVAADAILGGTGTINGDISFATGSFLHIADLNDTLEVGGTVTFDPGFGINNLTGLDWDALDLDNPYTLLTTTQTFSASDISDFGIGNAIAVGTTGRQAYFETGSLQVVVIPEPSTLVLFGLALLSVAAFRKRR